MSTVKKDVLSNMIVAHKFADKSGCVLYHQQSGETLGLRCSLEEILEATANLELEPIKRKLKAAGFIKTINDE